MTELKSGSQSIGYDNIAGVNYKIEVPVRQCSSVDFVISPGDKSDDSCDSTTFTATIDGFTSSLNDPSGDAEPAHLDVIGAESIQTGDFIQFSMTMAGDVLSQLKQQSISG